MDHRISKVAVIGAGISGVCAASHLLKLGLEVVVFERGDVPGGVWHYDERISIDPKYPSNNPSSGDQIPVQELYSGGSWASDLDIEAAHSAPGPCYKGLNNNVSTRLMRTTLLPWPDGIGDFVNQVYLEEYIQGISRTTGVHRCTQYRTRVEEVRKVGKYWQVSTISLVKRSSKTQPFLQQRQETFDAVVVASGHYNAPRIPDIKGLASLKKAWSNQVLHSKQYRTPERFAGKTVLLIGAGVSSTDIAREISPVAKKVYQSSRGGKLDLPVELLPPEASRVGGILSFETSDDGAAGPAAQNLSCRVNLVDGTSLEDVDCVILCTGYMISYPYLQQFHSDETSAVSADEDVLVTSEGEMVHNCWKDTFYIPDPTLSLVGTPYHIATFSLFEFQAMAVARVFAGLARLPSAAEMRKEYKKKLLEKGAGRDFHSLRGVGEEQKFVIELVDWLNRDAVELGHNEMLVGHTEEWHAANRDREEKLAWLRAIKVNGEKP